MNLNRQTSAIHTQKAAGAGDLRRQRLPAALLPEHPVVVAVFPVTVG